MTEAALRGRLRRRGLALRKSRASISVDNHGGYQVLEARQNVVIAGRRFDLSLEDVAEWIRGEDE